MCDFQWSGPIFQILYLQGQFQTCSHFTVPYPFDAVIPTTLLADHIINTISATLFIADNKRCSQGIPTAAIFEDHVRLKNLHHPTTPETIIHLTKNITLIFMKKLEIRGISRFQIQPLLNQKMSFNVTCILSTFGLWIHTLTRRKILVLP